MTMRLGLSSGALYPAHPTEQVPEIAARLGVSEIEVMLQTAGEYDPAFIRRIAAACRAHGVRVHAIHSFHSLHPFATPYPRRTAEARALFARGIEAAAALGAGAIVWHGFSRAEATGDGAWDRFIDTVADLAGLCAAANITLAIENVSWCIVATVRDALALAARLPEIGPASTVGFAFDPFQAAEAGANPFMMLAAMEGGLVDIHLSDRREHEPSARHLPPGDGDLPWPALLRAIAAAGYAGPLIVEGALGPEPGPTMRRIRDHLEPLFPLVAEDGDPCDAPLPPGVLAGIALFNDRRFYECHEEIEHEWHAERGPIRRLYQGILQIGVGFHHARGGNHRGAVLLLGDGIEKVSHFFPACRGVDTARLVAGSQRCLDQIVALGPEGLSQFEEGMIPRVWMI